MTHNVLRIDTSARHTGSVSRELADKIVARIDTGHVTTRDLAVTPVPQIDEAWIGANFTPPADRTPEQVRALAL